jgi:RNA polymerase sigma factor (sigma-70 family)
MLTLTNITKAVIKDIKENVELQDEFMDQLNKYAWFFVLKNPVPNYEREDYVQDLLWHAWKNLDKYDEKKGTSFTTFIYFCWSNVLKMFIRSLKRRPILLENTFVIKDGVKCEYLDTIPDDTPQVLDTLIKNEFNTTIMSGCGDILLDYLNGSKQCDLANKYNLSQPTISKIIKRNIESIRSMVHC